MRLLISKLAADYFLIPWCIDTAVDYELFRSAASCFADLLSLFVFVNQRIDRLPVTVETPGLNESARIVLKHDPRRLLFSILQVPAGFSFVLRLVLIVCTSLVYLP